jgi:hypothetical protein
VYHIALEENGIENQSLSEADQKYLKECGYPFTQLGGIQLMWQGVPTVPCPNRKCENHKYDGTLQVLAVVWNEPLTGVFLWNKETEDNDVQVIFQICPKCKAIYACNRCT